MQPPDVIGFVLEEALQHIRASGIQVDSIQTTKPIKATEPMGIARVVRLTVVDEVKLRVVVAYENYGKGGVL